MPHPQLSRPTWTQAEWESLVRWLETTYDAGAEDAVVLIGRGAVAAHEYAERRAGELVGRRFVDGEWIENPVRKWVIDDTIRDTVQRLVAETLETGDSVGGLHERLLDTFADIPGRALMIARTETAFGYNAGALANYAALDVTKVQAEDGGTAGSCDECNDFDGTVMSVDEAAMNLIAHPNCGRSWVPVLED